MQPRDQPRRPRPRRRSAATAASRSRDGRDRIVAARLAAGLSLSASGVSAGPSPPVRRMPWQEPQSCRSSVSSSRWRAGVGLGAPGCAVAGGPPCAGSANATVRTAARARCGRGAARPRLPQASRHIARTYATSCFASSGVTLFGGIGIGPRRPARP